MQILNDIEQLRKELYLEIERSGLDSTETKNLSNKFNEMINLYYSKIGNANETKEKRYL